MEYRRLGKSGLQVSALALGAGFKYGDQMGEDEVRLCMVAAREAGVNFFDNAEGHGLVALTLVDRILGGQQEDLRLLGSRSGPRATTSPPGAAVGGRRVPFFGFT